jgi:hypothetical protein
MTQPGRLRTFCIALFAYAAGVASPAAWAQQATANTRVYTVELVVFRNMGGTGGTEDWTAKPAARGPDKPDSPVTGRFIQSLPPAQFKLSALDQKLQNTANYQPIAHFAWQQTASSWGSRAGFPIAKLAGNVPGLSGFVFLESGDYLHLGMTLNYQASNPPPGLQAPPGTVFTLSESRRVKWDQLNYYDHPAFGVVALVTPADRGTGGR